MTATSHRAVRRTGCLLLACLAVSLFPLPAAAFVHLWRIQELYSNADGNIQYLELFTTDSGETMTNGEHITITSNGPNGPTSHTFTFNRDLTGTTANRALLIATPGYSALTCAPAADFSFTTNRVFDPQATTITVTLPFAEPVDTIVFPGVPTDGTNSVNRTLTQGPSSPANQANASGTLGDCDDATFCNGAGVCAFGNGSCGPITMGPCPQLCDETDDECIECFVADDCPNDTNPCTDRMCTDGSCGMQNNTAFCNDGNFCTTTDTCAGGACSGTGNPCSGGTPMCNETDNRCDECLADADCDDDAVCTDDDCASGTCVNTNNSAPCNDGNFCTATDTCSGGACGGTGNPCSGSEPLCDETANECVECFVPGDCNDGMFCNGGEGCAAGACQAGTPPCSGVCVEASDACVACTSDGECDDGNECTTDDCDGNGDCVETPVTAGTPCTDDGLFCTGAETCGAGTCTGAGDPCDPGSQLCDDGADQCVRRCDDGSAAVSGACPEDVDPDLDAGSAGSDAGPAGADAAVDGGVTTDGGDMGSAGRGGTGGRPARDAGSAGAAGDEAPRDAGGADASDSSGGSSGCDCRIAGATRARETAPAGALWLVLAAAALRVLRRARSRSPSRDRNRG